MTVLSFLSSTSYYIAIFVLAVATSAAVLLYFGQTYMIYPSMLPEGSRTKVDKPDKHNMPHYTEVDLTTSDKVKLHAYMITKTSRHEAPTIVLYMHGNAGNIGHRLPIAQGLMHYVDTSVFMLSYRGFGKSQGFAHEAGLKIDAECALDHLKTTYPKSRIVIYGQSIGGAVAINLVSQNEHRTHCKKKLIPLLFPAVLAPLIFMCTEKWVSEQTIQLIKRTPILFLSGTADKLIPNRHMHVLFDLVGGRRSAANVGKDGIVNGKAKQVSKSMKGECRVYWKAFEDGDHNNTVQMPGYFEAIKYFMKEL